MHTTRRPIVTGFALGLLGSIVLVGGFGIAQEVDTGDGASIYQAQCAACHQATGAGVPGAFPPLAGHVHDFLAVDQGRTYPILVVLYGLAGPITVDGAAFDAMMPPMGHLDDAQIADVLNYIMTAWDDVAELEVEFEPYTAADVEEHRGRGLAPADVHAVRQELGLE